MVPFGVQAYTVTYISVALVHTFAVILYTIYSLVPRSPFDVSNSLFKPYNVLDNYI